ncbi:MAG TPA: hypothetical protein VGM90_04360 [Kofleriaceae bacterium]|jgi:hypothetical protein
MANLRAPLLFVALALSPAAIAAPNAWTKCMHARPYRIVEVGNDTIVSGEYYGGGDLGDGKARGHSALFVARYGAKGEILWEYAVSGRVDIKDLAVDTNGSVILVGDAYEAIDFGAGSTPLLSSYEDAWIASLGKDGKLQWAKRYGKPGGYNELSAVTVSATEISATAKVAYGTDLGAGPIGKPKTNKDETQLLRVRWGRDGKLIDAKPTKDEQVPGKPSLRRDEEGDAPRVTTLSYDDGAHKWKSSFDNSGRGISGTAVLGPTGGAYTAGSFEYELELDAKHRLETPQVSPFIAAYGADGALQWASAFGAGATSHDNAWIDEIAFASSGSILVGGPAYGTFKIDGKPVASIPNPPTLTSVNDDKDTGFVAALGADGKVKWARSYPARVGKVAAGQHIVVVYGHDAGPDQQCIAHDSGLPE